MAAENLPKPKSKENYHSRHGDKKTSQSPVTLSIFCRPPKLSNLFGCLASIDQGNSESDK
jgi:hypothetical protein